MVRKRRYVYSKTEGNILLSSERQPNGNDEEMKRTLMSKRMEAKLRKWMPHFLTLPHPLVATPSPPSTKKPSTHLFFQYISTNSAYMTAVFRSFMSVIQLDSRCLLALNCFVLLSLIFFFLYSLLLPFGLCLCLLRGSACPFYFFLSKDLLYPTHRYKIWFNLYTREFGSWFSTMSSVQHSLFNAQLSSYP